MIITILVFLLILTVLVLIHEAGHFFVAKKLGIKVEEFGVGLPPRAFGIKRGETVYSVNWLPIGGFVKLYGEDDAGGGSVRITKNALPAGRQESRITDTGRAFYARPIWQRAIVVVAGVVMNFILSVVIITYFFGIAGVQTPGNKVIITDIVKNSPAEMAGLKVQDVVESINGTKITDPSQIISITRKHLGEKVTLKVIRESESQRVEENIEITPRKIYPSDEGPMGVAISPNVVITKYPLWKAPFVGLMEAFKYSWLIVAGLFGIVIQLFTHAQIPKGVAGPIGIAQLTGQFIAVGPMAVLSFVSLLSLNLAILNVLPIPALDGGRLFFILIEGVVGKKVSHSFESKAHAIGMAVLLALIVLITLSDLIRWISGQPILPKQ